MSGRQPALTPLQLQALQQVLELVEDGCPLEDAIARFGQGDAAVAAEAQSLVAMRTRADAESFMSRPAALPDIDPAEHMPERIGPYRITGFLGTGASGSVYRGVDSGNEREVAVKVLDRVLAQPDVRRRFEHEAQLLGALDHPAIARVLEAGTHRDGTTPSVGLPYIAMELVADASPITAYADAQHLDLQERVSLFASACDAIGHAHERGIVHRDVKPANLLVDRDGTVKVIDFGIGRMMDARLGMASMHTAQGRVVGTLQYMSPEQADGRVELTDARSDVYALGAVLYELLCGRPPYDVGSLSLGAAALAIRETPPVAPGAIDRRLRGDLERIVLTALNKDPRHRHGDARELTRELRRYVEDLPIDGAAHPRVSRRQIVEVAVAAVVLGIVVTMVRQCQTSADGSSFRSAAQDRGGARP